MDDKDKEINKLKRRIAGLEKTLRIVSGHSGRIEKNLKQLFEVISDTMPVPLLISSSAGEILFSNGKAHEIFGYSDKDFHEIKAADLYENSEDRQIFLKMLADTGEVRGFAVNLKKADNSVFPASLFSQPLIFEEKQCFLSLIYDLSEIRKEEEKRLTMERQLRQAHKMEAIGTMAGGIAHDFNNILAIIFGSLELAMMMLPEDNKARKQINRALTAGDRAKTMIMQILAFARKKEEEFKPFHISTIVSEAAKMIASITPSAIEIRLSIKSKSAIIMGDPIQIHQILMNLCANANYALKKRSGIIEICLEDILFDSKEKIMIPSLSPGAYVRLTVSDNGPGMDKTTIDRVFDPFFTTKPTGEGTGMGLAVVHGIIQTHAGAISVESEPGKGTAFHCYFPIIARTQNVSESFLMVEKTIQGGNEKILFVDDEKDILEVCCHMLKKLGYHVTSQSSSPEALRLFKKNPDLFDLVITDNTMPKMSGHEMALEILKIRPDIPVIMITGRKSEDVPLSEISASVVIQKPFTHNEIGTAIRKLLDKNQETEDE